MMDYLFAAGISSLPVVCFVKIKQRMLFIVSINVQQVQTYVVNLAAMLRNTKTKERKKNKNNVISFAICVTAAT